MRGLSAIAAICFVSLLASPAGAARAKRPSHAKGVVIRIPGEIVVARTPDAVWQTLTRDQALLTIAGFSPTSMGPSRRLVKIGDFVPASVGEDSGTLVVTSFDEDTRELRVFFEPQSGRYLCHVTIHLDPVGAGTRVSVVHRYTDDRVAAAVDKTARRAAADVPGQLAAFKALAEAAR